jgi:hypothetical protein
MANCSSAAVLYLTQTLERLALLGRKRSVIFNPSGVEIIVCIDHNNAVGTSGGAKWHVSFRDKTKMSGKKSQLIRYF